MTVNEILGEDKYQAIDVMVSNLDSYLYAGKTERLILQDG